MGRNMMERARFCATAMGILLCLTAPSPADAEGSLRDRIREKMQERVIKKMEERPAPERNASINDGITSPGDYYFSIRHRGLERFYRVHVPPSYQSGGPAALVFAFHGGGGDMEYMARDEYYGLVSKSDREGFVIVFPNGFSRFPSGKLATWNAGECCGAARDENIDDVGFVKEMVGNLIRQMSIDPDRIFATGMSNGGMMAYRLACELPGIFTAVASVTGTDNTVRCDPARTVSVLHIHAKNDDHVLFEGGAGRGSFRDETKVTDFKSVPETVSAWVSRNACNPEARRVLDKPGAWCDLYAPCEDGAAVKLCVTETGGHSWPGGYKPRGEETSKAISANDEIWAFFSSRR